MMNSEKDDPCPCDSGKKFRKCCGQDAIKLTFFSTMRNKPSAVPDRHAQEEAIAPEEINRLVSLFNAAHYVELESLARELSKQYPYAGFVWKMLGAAQKGQGKDALVALKRAAELMPNDAEAHNNLALALQNLGQLDAAAASCRRALLVSPDYAEAHSNLSNALRELNQLDAAAASCRRALEIDPELAQAHHSLGVVLRKQGRKAEAEASCLRALEIDPCLAGAVAFMAELHADNGQFSIAEDLFRRAIAIEPDSAEAWAGIASIRRMSKDDADWLAAAQEIAGRALSPRAEARLRFAIGKYYDDVGDFDLAFSQYQRANELGKLRGNEYNRQRQRLAVDVLMRVYSRDWIKREQINGSPSTRPVFIVGMPCSGTSLAEQILASHPQVFGAGEQGFWQNAAAIHAPSVLTGRIDEKVLPKLAGDYGRLLQGFSAGAERIVDNTQDNFLHLGLIHAAFPHARIIHMQRNPIDTCLSVYFQYANTSRAYANDLGDLAHYYTEYFRVMEHWRATLPTDAILHVPYEALVEDPERWSGKMLDFIDLPWDARCGDVHQSVRTDGNRQELQKISKTSVSRWRNYEKFVGPLQMLTTLGQPEREVAGTMQLLGNILRRAELTLRTDQQDANSRLLSAAGFHARRVAELALAVR